MMKLGIPKSWTLPLIDWFSENGDSTSIFLKIIGRGLSHSSSSNLYLRCQVDFASNTVGTKAPHFVDFGLPAVNASDEVNIFGTPNTRTRRPIDGSHWSDPDHVSGKATSVGISATRLEQYYSYKTDFEIWRENQDFRRQNISMSRTPLDSTPIGTYTTSGTTSPIDLIPIRTKNPEPTPQTRPKESPTRPMESSTGPAESSKRKGKEHVPADPE